MLSSTYDVPSSTSPSVGMRAPGNTCGNNEGKQQAWMLHVAVMCPPAPPHPWGCVPRAAPAERTRKSSKCSFDLCCPQMRHFLQRLLPFRRNECISQPCPNVRGRPTCKNSPTNLEHVAAVHQLCRHLALPLHHARLQVGEDHGGGKGLRPRQQQRKHTAASEPHINTSPAVKGGCACAGTGSPACKTRPPGRVS